MRIGPGGQVILNYHSKGRADGDRFGRRPLPWWRMNANVKKRLAPADERRAATGLFVNGEAVEVQAWTLSELLAELGYGDAKIATALNGDFVPALRRSETRLKSGDRIEVVAPRQGG